MNHNVIKRTFWHVCPAKIQISLRIRAVWSESSLGAFSIAKDANMQSFYEIQSILMQKTKTLIKLYESTG